MDFEIQAVFKRSVTIEISNHTICYTDAPYRVLFGTGASSGYDI